MEAVLVPIGLDFNKPVEGQGFGYLLILSAILSLIIITFTSLLALFFWFLFISKVHRVPKQQLEEITAAVIKKDPRERVMQGIYKWMLDKIY